MCITLWYVCALSFPTFLLLSTHVWKLHLGRILFQEAPLFCIHISFGVNGFQWTLFLIWPGQSHPPITESWSCSFLINPWTNTLDCLLPSCSARYLLLECGLSYSLAVCPEVSGNWSHVSGTSCLMENSRSFCLLPHFSSLFLCGPYLPPPAC